MNSLLYYIVQVIICAGILYGYYHVALRNKKFHRYNRYYLLMATVLPIIIPFFNIPVYFAVSAERSSGILQTIANISPDHAGGQPSVFFSSASHTSIFTLENISAVFYLIVTSFIFIRFLIAISYVKKLIHKYDVERIHHIYFINTDEPGTPFSFFKWLFWNKKIEVESEEGQQIFRHELFHIQQNHSRDVIFIEITSILFWVNPFLYFIKKEIKTIHEFLADEFSTKEKDKGNYAELLLMQALNTNCHRLINSFFHSQVKRRIAMITSSQKTGYQYLRKIMVLPFVVIMISLFAFNYKNKQYLKTNNIEHQNIDSIPKPHAKPSFFYSHPDKLILEADSLIFYPNSEKSKINFNNALIIINGQKKQSEILKEKTIISHKITFFSKEDPMTIEKFGEAGKNGVLVFENAMIIDIPPSEFYKNDFIELKISDTDNKIFEKVEIDASFPGGEAAWNNFIENNLKESIPVIKNAPAGTYTIWLQFIVDKEGNISDIKSLTNHGYGMEEEAIRVMQLSPKWIPATQNGHLVKAYRKQPVNFHVKKAKTEVSTIKNRNNPAN